jgi:hypothetical protein
MAAWMRNIQTYMCARNAGNKGKGKKEVRVKEYA